MNIYFCFYFSIACEVVTVLLIFVDIYHFDYTIVTRTYRGTQARMYDQHTRGMTTTRHRSLVGRDGRICLRQRPITTKKSRHTDISNQKKRFEQIELPAKLLDYFSASNKSNINQLLFLDEHASCSFALIDDASRLICRHNQSNFAVLM